MLNINYLIDTMQHSYASLSPFSIMHNFFRVSVLIFTKIYSNSNCIPQPEVQKCNFTLSCALPSTFQRINQQKRDGARE